MEEVGRPAAIGDTVLVDIKGTVGENSIMDNQDWELNSAQREWLAARVR